MMSQVDAATGGWKPPWYLRLLRIAAWVLYVWVFIGVISLLLRVFLLLFAANPEADFAAFVYRVSDAYLHPFRDIFPTRDLGDGGYLDVSALFAIVVYALIAGGVGAAIAAVGRRIERAERSHRAEMERLLLAQRATAAAPSGAQAIVGGTPAGRMPPAYPGGTAGAPPGGPAGQA
ncbi:YggT family protein [Agromyces arachidis]|uniref:YggT family protein n=1 Tax=Agromyces arachidis TaxID=766966 RepID=UPI00405772CE